MTPRAFRTFVVLLVAAGAVLVLALLFGRPLARRQVEARIRAEAESRGLVVTWDRLDVDYPAKIRILGLSVLSAADSSPVLDADSLRLTLALDGALRMRADVRRVELAHAEIRRPPRAAIEDTLALEEDEEAEPPAGNPRSERLRRTAGQIANALLLPARRLPAMELRDVTVIAGDEESLVRGAWLERFDVARAGERIQLTGQGVLQAERELPFQGTLVWSTDDRLAGTGRIAIPNDDGAADLLRLRVDGRLSQDRRAGVLRLADDSRVLFGTLPMQIGGEIRREGPRVRFALAADSITQAAVEQSVPPSVLGPLRDLVVAGSFDYRVRFDLDFANPDDVDFAADVIPHGLELDPVGTRLPILYMQGPFTATIRLPRGRVVTRELSPANPYFHPLGEIDPRLVHAVVTNEDGGFHRHGGFNVEAMQAAMAQNLKAGAFRRGAGTITMQLARNLFTGHSRTLSRKAQEVVLAWVLEHLTGLGKERLLEIYLNIIEWGPGIHGAGEAAWFYFGKPPNALTVDEALFLTILVPSPSKWRNRFAPDGALRSYARGQMHFIGRAMARKGWLDPMALPPREELHVELRGPARDILFPDAADSVQVTGRLDGRNPALPSQPQSGGFFDRLFRAIGGPFRRADPDTAGR